MTPRASELLSHTPWVAVASEPCIFWRGEGADEIIGNISISREIGRLIAADAQFNGPSGIALDDYILNPLGLKRDHAWLCDLVPHSCLNEAQWKAIKRSYRPLAQRNGLPLPSVPMVPTQLADDARRLEICDELRSSKAEVLILLGDEPIKWFLLHFDSRWRRLSDFQPYGQLHEVSIDGMELQVMPFAHPRQVARLGTSSERWFDAHRQWMMAQERR